jgi:hypothetical protein
VKVSLAEAIKAAANKHRDAKVVDVSFDSQAGQLAYKVKTYQGNNVWEGAVDAWTGQIIGEGTTTPVSKLDEEDQLELAGLQKSFDRSFRGNCSGRRKRFWKSHQRWP